MTHVVKGQAGDARNRGHDLQVIFVELRGWAGAVQVDGAQDPLSHQQRNAEQGAYFQLRQGLDLAQRLVAQDIAYQQADAVFQNPLHHGAADPDRMAGPAHPVPGRGRSELFRMIAEQNGAALGRDHVEYEAQKLPLQRVLIANAANPGGDLQQGIEVARPAGTGRQIGHDLVRLQVERVFRPKQKRRTLETRRLQEFNRILVEVFSVLFEQEDEYGIADIDLVAVPYLLLLHRHAVDQRAVAAFQIPDGELFVVGQHQAVPARQCGISRPKLVRGVTADGYFAGRQRESRALQRTADANQSGIFLRHAGCCLAYIVPPCNADVLEWCGAGRNGWL